MSYVAKETINNMRKLLKVAKAANRKSIDVLSRNIEFVNVNLHFRQEHAYNPVNATAWVSGHANLPLSPYASIDDIKKALTLKQEKKYEIDAKLQSLLTALTKDGFQKVTYSLPLFAYICRDTNIAVPFMMVTGIAKNAKEKQSSDDFMDDFEKELFDYEIKMAEFIEDDFFIGRENMRQFLSLYEKYLELYKKYEVEDKNFELLLFYVKNNLLSMGFYITFCNTYYFFSEKDIWTLRRLFENYMATGLVSELEAVCLICDIAFYECEKDEMRQKAREEYPKDDSLSEYIEDGTIIKSCNLEDFEELLNSTKMSSSQKRIYLEMMAKFLEREKLLAYKNKVEEFRKVAMSPEEIELYNLARCYQETKKTTLNIDAGIEMLMETTDELDRKILLEEIAGHVNELKRSFAPVRGTEKPEESVIYYTCYVEDEDNIDIKIPCLLKSVIADKGIKKYEVDRTLREIITGNGPRERKIKGTDLSYPVYTQGEDIRIFYTRIRDTLVIIDLAYGDEVYNRAKEVVNTSNFQEFIKEVETYLATGQRPNAKGFTDLIKTSLNRSEKIIKLV